MANTGPHSGGSQIFINTVDNPQLDWFTFPETKQHPVFGKVIEGFEVISTIEKVRVVDEIPIDPIKVTSMSIVYE